MRKRLLLFLALLSFVACGGGGKSSAGPGADLEATPVATETAAENENEAVTEDGGDREDDVCAWLCARVMACAVEVSGQEPTDEQLTEARQQCRADCGEEDADGVEAASQCVARNPGSCPGLFECVQALKSGS